MRHLGTFIIAIALCTSRPEASYGEPSRIQAPIDSRFMLTPFVIRDGAVVKRKPRLRSEVVKSRTFTVVVVASWCGYSQQLLRNIAKGTSSIRPDLILFKHDEIGDFEDIAIGHGRDEQQVRAWAKERRASGQLLADPEGIDHDLRYYLVPNEQLEQIGAFPTYLICNDRTCRRMTARERLNSILRQGGMDPI